MRSRGRSAGPRRWTPVSSQANVGGYKAVLIAANEYGRYFPLLTTAAGTAKPANVLILGIGVAGLQAIGTARRLGAVVKAYDVRPETREQAERLGAQFVKLKTDDRRDRRRRLRPRADRRGAGRPAGRAQRGHRRDGHRDHDRPGPGPQAAGPRDRRRGDRMKPGSVIVDMAASALGGNCELSQGRPRPSRHRNGVTIIAPDNLPATMPAGASAFYARNISALLLGMVKDGDLDLDFEDEVTKATVITKDGAVVSDAVSEAARTGPARRRPRRPGMSHARSSICSTPSRSSCSRSSSGSRSSARSRRPSTRR